MGNVCYLPAPGDRKTKDNLPLAAGFDSIGSAVEGPTIHFCTMNILFSLLRRERTFLSGLASSGVCPHMIR